MGNFDQKVNKFIEIFVEQNGYEKNGPLYEVYITDPTQTSNEDEFITEIYYPVKKK